MALFGLSVICASCKWWKTAQDLGQDTCLPGGSLRNECGGPLIGMDFPFYEGPLKDAMAMVCFVCGETATGGIKIGEGRVCGLCEEHKKLISKLKADIEQSQQKRIAWKLAQTSKL